MIVKAFSPMGQIQVRRALCVANRESGFDPSAQNRYSGAAGVLAQQRYNGRRIDIDLKDADVHNVLRLLADTGHVNIVTGRATFTDGPPKLYAYVHKEVKSAAARLDQFLSQNGVASDERVTVISDDAGEFAKTVEGSQLARGRVLDWFHIAMKFKAAQRSVFGSKMIASLERESVETEITHAKWLVWHGKGSKAVERIKALDARLLTREGYEFSTLSMNLHGW